MAYTQLSFWQAYNSSAYFRETNYEPSMFFVYELPKQNKLALKSISLGAVHQSNGQGGDNERSWNRLFANFAFQPNDNWLVQLKPWIRIHGFMEARDYNPDITEYLGHGSLTVSYEYENNVFTTLLRNNLESGFKRGFAQAI